MSDPNRLRELIPVDDPSAAAWLSELVDEPWGREAQVDSIVPASFAAYARILHPAYQTEPLYFSEGEPMPYEEITTVEVPWSEIAEANGRVMHPQVQFESLVGYSDNLYRHKQSQLWSVPPQTGNLPFRQTTSLAARLVPYTTTSGRCWFAVWDGWGNFEYRPGQGAIVHLPYRNYYLYAGPLDAAGRPFNRPFASAECEPGDHAASIWWPDDHAWCVATDIDLMSTYVGGSRGCIAQVLAAPDLEVLPAQSNDGVSINSDRLNPLPVEDE